MSEMDELVSEFLVESYENLDRLDQDLLVLEQDADEATLASIFRTVHTIKGTCGFLGFGRLEALAHVAENLLGKLRDGELELTAPMSTALLATGDALREALDVIQTTGEEGTDDHTDLVETLTDMLDPASPARLGELLVADGVTDDAAVSLAAHEQALGDERRLGEILVDHGAVQPDQVTDALQVQQAQSARLSDSSIRVDVALLDDLMNLVGELVLARNQIIQLTADRQDSDIAGASQRLNVITTELQEGVMKTRMQPIGNVWNKLPRVVRDLSLACDKRVRVEMDGQDTELDKTLLEAIKDPLTHLVRNAVDHGVETPEARVAAGKPAEGRLYLRAFHEGGHVNIEIADDGAGIDVEKVKARALERGLVNAEQAGRMTEREALNLVFAPGFSTAQTVSNVSGRGVGMDVVKTNIERIGGTVDLYTEAGAGTTCKVKIPLTLAIIPALIITSGGDRYAIPQLNLVELVRLEGEQARSGIESLHGAPVYRLRGRLLPVVSLAEQLGVARSNPDVVNIVVLQADGQQFGLIVDEISDTQEIVVKPLGSHLHSATLFAGATIMGDGLVALILDVLGVAQRSGVVSEHGERAAAEIEDDDAGTASERQTLLVVGVGEDRQAALALADVARLEEFPATTLEWASGREVVQYRDEILPLVRLSDALGTGGYDPPAETLNVVVHAVEGKSVGLLVGRIVDIVEQEVRLDGRHERPGLLGSAVISGRVTDVLDVNELVIASDPARFGGPAYAGV